jgi:hypothetical protein
MKAGAQRIAAELGLLLLSQSKACFSSEPRRNSSGQTTNANLAETWDRSAEYRSREEACSR